MNAGNRSWLKEMGALNNVSPEGELHFSEFGATKDGIPFVRSEDGLLFHGLPNNQAWKRVYDRQSNGKEEGISLEEFSIRSDIKHRYFKNKQHLRCHIRPGDTVVELGAYIGYYSMHVAKQVGNNGKIRAVELMPELHHILAKNLAPYAKIAETVNKGVSDSNSVQVTFCGGGQRNGFRRDVIAQGGKPVKEYQVETDTIEGLISDLEKVDLCILQLNGTELDCLQTISEGWSKIANFAIAANYDEGDIRAPQPIADLLDRHGYATEIYNRWVYARQWPTDNQRQCTQQPPPIFIGGCGRSGTTLLRVMLDSHPNIACGPESNLILNPMHLDPEALGFKFDMSAEEIIALADNSAFLPDFMVAFMNKYAGKRDKRRWAEKTPRNVRHIDYIFDNFPGAYFIHVIRDGRDVACSLKSHPKFKVVDGQRVPNDVSIEIDQCIERWIQDVKAGLAWRGHRNYIEIKYEELVTKPEATMRSLLMQLNEPWSDDILDYYNQLGSSRDVNKFPQNKEATHPLNEKRIGRWRDECNAQEIKIIREKAESLLNELGYNDW